MNKKFILGVNLLLLFFYITSVKSVLATSEPGSSNQAVTVRIFNKMRDGSNFTIHCKSKDDDLGTHVVGPDESPYEWRFHPNIWGTTLFFCNTYWEDKFIGFNGYEAKRDYMKRCQWLCVWKASQDGLYGYTEWPTKADIHYMWE